MLLVTLTAQNDASVAAAGRVPRYVIGGTALQGPGSTETVILRLSAPTPGVTLGTPFDATSSIANSGLF